MEQLRALVQESRCRVDAGFLFSSCHFYLFYMHWNRFMHGHVSVSSHWRYWH